MAFLDTSFVVRYLAGIPADSANEAAAVIDQLDGLQISGVVIAETAYVLTTVYQVPRPDFVDRLIEFIQRSNISTFGLEKAFVIQGLRLCRPSGRVSFANALIWSAARSGGADVVYSLDHRFPAYGIEVRRMLPEP